MLCAFIVFCSRFPGKTPRRNYLCFKSNSFILITKRISLFLCIFYQKYFFCYPNQLFLLNFALNQLKCVVHTFARFNRLALYTGLKRPKLKRGLHLIANPFFPVLKLNIQPKFITLCFKIGQIFYINPDVVII